MPLTLCKPLANKGRLSIHTHPLDLLLGHPTVTPTPASPSKIRSLYIVGGQTRRYGVWDTGNARHTQCAIHAPPPLLAHSDNHPYSVLRTSTFIKSRDAIGTHAATANNDRADRGITGSAAQSFIPRGLRFETCPHRQSSRVADGKRAARRRQALVVGLA